MFLQQPVQPASHTDPSYRNPGTHRTALAQELSPNSAVTPQPAYSPHRSAPASATSEPRRLLGFIEQSVKIIRNTFLKSLPNPVFSNPSVLEAAPTTSHATTIHRKKDPPPLCQVNPRGGCSLQSARRPIRTRARAELEGRVLGKFAAVLLMISLEHYVRQTFQNYTISMNKRKKKTCQTTSPVPQDSQFQKTRTQDPHHKMRAPEILT